MSWPLSLVRPRGGGTSQLLVLSVAAGVAAALYVAFGPGPKKLSVAARKRRRRLGVPKGLRNDAMNCFINSILQGLSACPSFHAWLRQRRVLRRSPSPFSPTEPAPSTSSSAASKLDLETALVTVLDDIRGEDDNEDDDVDVVQTQIVSQALRCHGWNIDTSQHDAHEFFHVLLTTLEEQIALKKDRGGANLSDLLLEEGEEEEVPEEASVAEDDDNAPPPPPSASNTLDRRRCKRRSSGVFSRAALDELSVESVQRQTESARGHGVLTPFSGTFNSRLTFATDGKPKSPTLSNGFADVTLNLPSQRVFGTGGVTLERLLASFVSREPLADSGTADSPPLVKQITFGKLPPCLCLHIQRITFEGGMPGKIGTKVVFGQKLDMAPFVYSPPPEKKKESNEADVKKKEIWYSLRAVVEHKGGVNSGHYVTFRRGPADSRSEHRWYGTSDAEVSEVDFATVAASEGYMFFYEKEKPAAVVREEI